MTAIHSKKPRRRNETPVKVCPECFGVAPVAKRACDFCGFTWPTRAERQEAEMERTALAALEDAMAEGV